MTAGPGANPTDLYHRAPCGLATIDRRGAFLAINRTMLEWLGFDDDSNLPRFQSLLRVGDRIYWETHVAPLLEMEGQIAEIAMELTTRDGTASVLLNARNTNPGHSESRIDLVVFPAEDRRNYERELLAARRVAEESEVKARELTETLQKSKIALREALKEKGTFIATVSHELRTPLTAVVGLSALLLDSGDLPPDVREMLELIDTQSTEMSHIIEDLLASARADHRELSVDPVPIDSASEAEAAVTGRHIEVQGTDDVLVLADPLRLRQVIRNLVTNAERYGRPPIEVHVAADGEAVRFEVSDAGPPIAVEDRDRIFAPYETAHRDNPVAGSVGLGLALCRSLARRMGGDISYRHDGRSVFSLHLPRYIEREATK